MLILPFSHMTTTGHTITTKKTCIHIGITLCGDHTVVFYIILSYVLNFIFVESEKASHKDILKDLRELTSSALFTVLRQEVDRYNNLLVNQTTL